MSKSFELLKAETLPLTRDLAERHRDLISSPTERPLKSKRIVELTERIVNGQGVTFNWVTAELEKKIYRMNGQHSATTLCTLNGEFPEDLYVHLDHFKVETKEDLAELFRQFDSRMSARSPDDVAGAYQGLESDLDGVANPNGKLAIDGIDWHDHFVVGIPPRKGDDKYRLFHHEAYHDFIKWLDGLITKKNRELKPVAVVAAIWATYSANAEEAAGFWMDAAKGGDQIEEDVAYTLSKWLIAGLAPRSGYKQADFYQGCIFAWNVFREGKSTVRIKHDASKGFFDVVE